MQRVSKYRGLQSPNKLRAGLPADRFCLGVPICDKQVTMLTLRTV